MTDEDRAKLNNLGSAAIHLSDEMVEVKTRLDGVETRLEETNVKLDRHISNTDRGFATVIRMFNEEREYTDRRFDEMAVKITRSVAKEMERILGLTEEHWSDERRGLGEGIRANRERLDRVEEDVQKLKRIV